MMITTKELIVEAKKLANDNYESWGQYVVECYTDSELEKDLSDFDSLEDWVDIRIRVADVLEERQAFYE
jgi:hypothetical protein